jgi:hypothetical protein
MMNFPGSIHQSGDLKKTVDVCCGVYFGCLSRVAVWLYYFLTRPLASDHKLDLTWGIDMCSAPLPREPGVFSLASSLLSARSSFYLSSLRTIFHFSNLSLVGA